MKYSSCFVLCVCLLSVEACTTRGAYEAIRQNDRNECYRKPSDADRAGCLERTQDTFDEYNRKRDAAIADQAKQMRRLRAQNADSSGI